MQVKKLPKIILKEEQGKEFYFDARLGQLREVGNPSNYKDLDKNEVEYYKRTI